LPRKQIGRNICNIPKFYQILEWNFCFDLLCWLKFHRDLKTFWVCLKDLL
jgi:hypothetical protein